MQSKYPDKIAVGTAWAGFDDSKASWSLNRHMAQRCGQTFSDTMKLARQYARRARHAFSVDRHLERLRRGHCDRTRTGQVRLRRPSPTRPVNRPQLQPSAISCHAARRISSLRVDFRIRTVPRKHHPMPQCVRDASRTGNDRRSQDERKIKDQRWDGLANLFFPVKFEQA